MAEYCYTIIGGKPNGKNVGIIKFGEAGYYLTDYEFGVGAAAEDAVRDLNDQHGIDKETQMEFELKSMFVW